MSNLAITSVSRPNIFNRIANSNFMVRARQVQPKTLIVGTAVIGLGAFLAYLATKMSGNSMFTPIGVSGKKEPKINTFA